MRAKAFRSRNSQVDYTNRFLHELATQPGFADTFLRDRRAPQALSCQRLPALAATFESLAKRGLDDFYRGATARLLAAELERLGSPLRLPICSSTRHRSSTPLATKLSVGTAYNLPPPTQGLASLMILAIFDRIRSRIEPDTARTSMRSSKPRSRHSSCAIATLPIRR